MKRIYFIAFLAIVIGLMIVVKVVETNDPPSDFPLNNPVVVEEGLDVRSITKLFQEAGVVKSRHLLYYVLVIFHDQSAIKASTYTFDAPMTTLEIAERLTEGDFNSNLVRFTHFEGEPASLVAERASQVLTDFDKEKFKDLARDQEGKLFPDTYLIPINFSAEELLQLLTTTFALKISPLEGKISESNMSLDDVLILASIIEREANSSESMKLVSGIFQNRMAIGMPLQADASIEYILEKPLADLKPADLKIDSPYNTYLYTGLPPTPIGNPGLEAIEAVLIPTESDYFYYLTGNDGEFYYAKTYSQHLSNIEKYLR